MKKVQTVLGSISPEELGVTLPHIHIYEAHARDPKDPTECLPDIEKNIKELEFYKKVGGKSVVDGSPIQDVKILVDISKQSKVNIVSTTGLDWRDKSILERNIEEVASILIKNVKEGVADTGIKCGVLKSGASYNVITPIEEKALKIVAKAQLETGAPIFLHTTIGTMGIEMLESLNQEGVDLERVMVGHIDRNPDLAYHRGIVKMGANLLYDQISKVKYWPVGMTVDIFKKLVKEGFEEQIMLSLDFGHWTDLKAYGGGPGYTYILEKFIPRLKNEGFKETTIDNFMKSNPMRILSF